MGAGVLRVLVGPIHRVVRLGCCLKRQVINNAVGRVATCQCRARHHCTTGGVGHGTAVVGWQGGGDLWRCQGNTVLSVL